MSKIMYIVMHVQLGSSLGEVIQDAAKLSLEHRCNVKFVFNKTPYVFRFNTILDCVEEEKDD